MVNFYIQWYSRFGIFINWHIKTYLLNTSSTYILAFIIQHKTTQHTQCSSAKNIFPFYILKLIIAQNADETKHVV